MRFEWLIRRRKAGRQKPPVGRLRHMNARVGHFIDAALQLAPDERSAVVLALLDSLDGEDDATVARVWADEIRRHEKRLESGAARVTPWSEARARLDAL